MNTGTKILIAALVVVASVFGFWEYFTRSQGSRPRAQAGEKAEPEWVGPYTPLANPSAAKYKPPQDREPDMQLYDKAVLYLMDVQEPDGHFDSARAGAAPEFCNLNGDIANTALAAWVLMGASTGLSQNPEAVRRAKLAVKWMESKLRPDGFIADINAPGEPVVAQLFAADTFRVATSYSTRDKRRELTNKLASAALLKMRAKNGGYGPDANSEEPRPDVLALASFVYKYASLDGYKFDAFFSGEKPKNGGVSFANEDLIVDNLRAGMKRLDAKAHPSGAIFTEKAGGPSDWRATVSGMQAMFLINPSRSSVLPALNFMLGELDKKTESFPLVTRQIAWGKNGEGYDALTMWQGTISIIYMFTDAKIEFKSWTENVREILRAHQTAEGSWPVAGMDSRRGRVWRTCLHAMTLILTSPPPPPPGPAPDNPPTVTPPPPDSKKK